MSAATGAATAGVTATIGNSSKNNGMPSANTSASNSNGLGGDNARANDDGGGGGGMVPPELARRLELLEHRFTEAPRHISVHHGGHYANQQHSNLSWGSSSLTNDAGTTAANHRQHSNASGTGGVAAAASGASSHASTVPSSQPKEYCGPRGEIEGGLLCDGGSHHSFSFDAASTSVLSNDATVRASGGGAGGGGGTAAAVAVEAHMERVRQSLLSSSNHGHSHVSHHTATSASASPSSVCVAESPPIHQSAAPPTSSSSAAATQRTADVNKDAADASSSSARITPPANRKKGGGGDGRSVAAAVAASNVPTAAAANHQNRRHRTPTRKSGGGADGGVKRDSSSERSRRKSTPVKRKHVSVTEPKTPKQGSKHKKGNVCGGGAGQKENVAMQKQQQQHKSKHNGVTPTSGSGNISASINNNNNTRKRGRLQYPPLALQSSSAGAGCAGTSTPTPDNNNSAEKTVAAVGPHSMHPPTSPPGRNLSPTGRTGRKSPRPEHSSTSRDRANNNSSSSSNPASSHAKQPASASRKVPPANNTSLYDFFKSSSARPQASSGSAAGAAPRGNQASSGAGGVDEAVGGSKSVTNSMQSSSLATTKNNTSYPAAMSPSSSSSSEGESSKKELERLRHQCETLQRLCDEKEEKLRAVSNNQTILHSTLKTALIQKEEEFNRLKTDMQHKSDTASEIIEKLIRSDTSRESNELRQRLASDGARLGRLVYTRTGMHTVESWEDGHASTDLRRRRAELGKKREALERRQREARKASRRVTKENKGGDASSSSQHPEMGPPPSSSAGANSASTSAPGDGDRPLVGGLSVQDELDAMEAEESVRLHLANLKQEEARLAEEERALNAEKAAHIRTLKRLAGEDASRFHHRPKLNDRYVLLNLLGKGGFSEVWRAYDVEDLRTVAVKIHQIDPRWSDSKRENYTKHVSREYQIHRDVRHPRIVSLFDVFEIDAHSFATVLECCGGTDLDALLKARGCLPERDARAILLQILDGMRYLSLPSPDGTRQGIIHYDLKPGNILFDEDGDAKITDFGLSKIVDAADPGDSMELTSQGAGTYWYLPPECFVTHQQVRISNKVDVWSIGVIYYQMLFGKRPFGDGQSQDRVLSDHTMLNAREVKFPPRPAVSRECKDFIQLCLSYDQTFRPTIGELCASRYLYQKKV